MKNLIFIFFIVIVSCDTDTEYVGRYVLYECKLQNGDPCSIRESYLKLDIDKTFVLKRAKINLNGQWDFYDDGEAAILELTSDEFRDDCMVGILEDGRTVIEFGNVHSIFDNDSIESVMFVMDVKK
jgi:hypothetical protein